jgi:TctA family transporter
MEADLMRRVLDADAFSSWLDAFLPGIDRNEPAAVFTPAVVSDRSDAYIVHLDGLNLSRAWCWRAIGAALPQGDPRTPATKAAAAAHLAAGLEGVASGDYAGDHWLATFAVLALTT